MSNYNTEEYCLLSHSGFNPGNITYCSAIHDGLLCWPPALPGTDVKQNCPRYQGLDPSKHAYRKCGLNSTWEEIKSSIITIGKTNFAECMISEDNAVSENAPLSWEFKETAKLLSIIGIILLLLSLICIVVVLFIYSCILPKFVNTILHVRIKKQIYLSLIFDGLVKLLTQIVVLHQLIDPANNLLSDEVSFLCEILASMNQYAELTVITWVALDSHFLQINSKSGYLCSSGYMIYCVVGWAIPVIPIAVWVVTLAVHHKVSCWRDYSASPLMWIVEVPKLCFMIMTITMLVISCRRFNKEKYRNMIFELDNFKSEIIMTSGFSFIIMISVFLVMVPMHVTFLSSRALQHVATVFTSSRGIFMTILYAFINRSFITFLRHNEARIPCKKYFRII